VARVRRVQIAECRSRKRAVFDVGEVLHRRESSNAGAPDGLPGNVSMFIDIIAPCRLRQSWRGKSLTAASGIVTVARRYPQAIRKELILIKDMYCHKSESFTS
jgi:hypothetical protein